MKLFLTSSNDNVTKDFVRHLDKDPSEFRLTFIPTAAEAEKGDMQWLMDDRQALVDAGFEVTDFTLTGKTPAEVAAMLANTDFVFVSGGNTFYLLQEMKKSGFDMQIRSFVEAGGWYGGSSAGSIVAGPNIGVTAFLDDPTLAPELKDYQGLGLTDVLIFPHWGSEYFHEKYGQFFKIAYQKGEKIILLTDDQYLLCQDGTYTIESV